MEESVDYSGGEREREILLRNHYFIDLDLCYGLYLVKGSNDLRKIKHTFFICITIFMEICHENSIIKGLLNPHRTTETTNSTAYLITIRKTYIHTYIYVYTPNG